MTVEQSIFWYGLKAGLIQFVGAIITFFGLASLLFGSIILTLIIFLVGLLIFLKGKAMRFQYKLRSGTIIHRGDW